MIFDTHSHIIPNIDDGARDYKEAEELIISAKEQGVTDIIATPHYYAERPSNPNEIREKLSRLNELNTGVKLYAGNEVLYFDSMVEKLENGEILTLADTNFVLVEFYPRESYQRILRAVRDLRFNGFLPIVAHAERYMALKEDEIEEIILSGGYIQLSFEPLGHSFLNSRTRQLRRLLKNGMVHFLCTDMHRIDKRPPRVLKGYDYIIKNIDDADSILYENAIKMTKNIDFLR